MKQKLLIFPCNGNALEAIDCLGDKFDLIGCIDDTEAKQGTHPLGFEVFSRSAIDNYPDAKILAVPGGPASYSTRDKAIESLGIAPERFATVISPFAHVSANAQIGTNTLIMAGVVVTSNAVIGNNVCVLPNSVIHHDSVVGDYTLIGSGVVIAGSTTIGSKCYIGSGVSIINNITIGDNTLVGIGSNVLRAAPANSKLVGNPAKNI